MEATKSIITMAGRQEVEEPVKWFKSKGYHGDIRIILNRLPVSTIQHT